MEKKSNKGLIVLVVILLLLVIGLGGYIAYDKVFSIDEGKEDVDKNKEAVEETENKIQPLAIPLIDEVLKQFDSIYINHKSLYGKDVYEISTISNNDLVQTAIKNINRETISFCSGPEYVNKIEVSYAELTEGLNKYILDKEINVDFIKTLGKSNSFPEMMYGVVDTESGDDYGIRLGKDGVYLFGTCDGFGPGLYPYIEKKVVKAEEDNDNVYIYQKQAFVEQDMSEDGIVLESYKDFNHTGKPQETMKQSDCTDMNWSLYNTYKYTFKKVGGAYYFEKLEKVIE